MEKFTKEFYLKELYLENRQKKRYNKEVFFFGAGDGYKVSDLIQKLSEVEKEFKDKEEVDLWVDASEYEESGEAYLMVSWVDWETEKDFELRMYEKEWAKERAVESLKRLIDRNPQEAVDYIKELKLV